MFLNSQSLFLKQPYWKKLENKLKLKMPVTRKQIFERTHFPANNRPKTGSEAYSKRVVSELFAAFKTEDATLDEESFKKNPLVIKEANYFTGEVKTYWKDCKSNKTSLYKHHDVFFNHVINFSEEDKMEVEDDVDDQVGIEEEVEANELLENDEVLRFATEEEPDFFEYVEEELDPHHFVDVEDVEEEMDLDYNEGNNEGTDVLIPPMTPTEQQEKFKGKHRTTKFRGGQKIRKNFGKEAVWLATKQELRTNGNWAAAKAFDDIKDDKELAKKVCAFIKTVKNEEEKPKVDAMDCLALLYDRDFSQRDWTVSFKFYPQAIEK